MAMIYKVLGFEADGHQGIQDGSLFNYLLLVWGNSIGNITNPQFDKSQNTSTPLIAAIYLVWMVN